MKAKLSLLVEALLVSSLVLGACTLPIVNTAGYITLIFPPTGSIYPLGTAIKLRGTSQYATSLPAVKQMNFWANGHLLNSSTSLDVTITGGNHAFVAADYSWTPPAAGEYLVQAEAIMPNSQISVSSPNRICVVDMNLPQADVGADGYTGPCPLPAGAVSSTATFSMTATAIPASITFPPLGGTSGCPEPSITFTANLLDSGHRAALVLVEYEALAGGSGGGNTVALNEVSVSFIANRLFAGTISGQLESLLSGNLVDASDNPIPGSVVWTARALDGTGATLATDGPHTIPATPCGFVATLPANVIQPILINTPTHTLVPTATSTATPTLTPTPLVCPQGTILNSGKNACLYATPTPKPKKPAGADCPSFGSASACKKNGCNWNSSDMQCGF